ncbi:MAG: hypothetical protein E7362_01925 [Clostridiales bacterium]|nr:hypothetical protein [Clostridiales bacterium]
MYDVLYLMQNVSPALGIALLVALFVLCLIFVIGTKILFLQIKSYFSPKLPDAPPVIEKPKQKRKKIRTVEIDPNEIDRVYFKKAN